MSSQLPEAKCFSRLVKQLLRQQLLVRQPQRLGLRQLPRPDLLQARNLFAVLQKVAQHIVTRSGQNAFGMKLHTFNRQSCVSYAHHDSVGG